MCFKKELRLYWAVTLKISNANQVWFLVLNSEAFKTQLSLLFTN